MKQETFFGVRKDSEKHLYVRRGDNNEVLITKTVNGESITEENTVHLMRKKPVNWGFSC